MAVLPSADSATEMPCLLYVPTRSVPNSLLPCWLQTPPLRVKTQAAPIVLLSKGPPTMAVLPSADSATEMPWLTPCFASEPVPTSSPPCCFHTLPLRVKTQAPPIG